MSLKGVLGPLLGSLAHPEKQEEKIAGAPARHNGGIMGSKRITLVIDSDLEQVSLVGMAINKICSLIPFSDTESDQIELCAVEGVNNCIEHAYGTEKGHKVEITLTLDPDRLAIDVCDTGKPMERELMEPKDISPLQIVPSDLDSIAEEGRGLSIMNEIMDGMTYRTESGRNCLTLLKNIKTSRAQKGG